MVPEFQIEQLRELIVRDYRVVYMLDRSGDDVRIYAIHHGSRDFRKLFSDLP